MGTDQVNYYQTSNQQSFPGSSPPRNQSARVEETRGESKQNPVVRRGGSNVSSISFSLGLPEGQGEYTRKSMEYGKQAATNTQSSRMGDAAENMQKFRQSNVHFGNVEEERGEPTSQPERQAMPARMDHPERTVSRPRTRESESYNIISNVDNKIQSQEQNEDESSKGFYRRASSLKQADTSTYDIISNVDH